MANLTLFRGELFESRTQFGIVLRDPNVTNHPAIKLADIGTLGVR